MSGEHTPEPKPLDARLLSEVDLAYLSKVAWNYAHENKPVQCRDYLQDMASLRGHIDAQSSIIAALTAELAERKQQVRELIDADHELTLARRAVSYRPSKWPIPDEDAFRVVRASDRKRAALAPFSTETSDG